MLPNNHELMYRYARQRDEEIRKDVELSRDRSFDARLLRRRLMVIAGVGLIGLTLAVTMLALGWWIL
jgi:phosphoglycerate dehydrogenase-like enzyme